MLKRAQEVDGKIIYDHEVSNHPEVLKGRGKKKYKLLPKKYKTNSSVAIFGDYIAIYTDVELKKADRDITIYILKNKMLAKDYKKWFDFMWDMIDD